MKIRKQTAEFLHHPHSRQAKFDAYKLPNDLLILHNQPLTAVQPIVLSSFQTLHTEKLKVLDQKCIEINSGAGRNQACVSGTFVVSWVFSLC